MRRIILARRLAWAAASLAVLLVLGLRAGPAAGAVFRYEDDFETNKATTDSYSHSVFTNQAVAPEIAYLSYEEWPPGHGIPEAPRDGVLVFHPGLSPQPSGAHLGYEVLPPGAVATGGFVAFDRPAPEDRVIAVRASADGTTWTTLGESPDGPAEDVSIPVPPGTAARFIELRGGGIIDDLRIEVAYVPEPAGVLCAGLAAGMLLLRRREGAGPGDHSGSGSSSAGRSQPPPRAV